MRVALAHDSLTQYGGAERVLQTLQEIFPEAPIFTLAVDRRIAREHFTTSRIISSPLQYLYNLLPRFQMLLPLIPLAIKFFSFENFDLVISSSSIFIKAIRVPKRCVHVNYCHTPARLLWLETEQYLKDELPAVLRPFAKAYLRLLKRWDYRAAQRVNYFIANSTNVRRRIEKFYGRESVVIYPFIDTEIFYPSKPKEDFYLVVSRLQAHKRTDLAVSVFNKNHKQLHVIGTGRALRALKKQAAENIAFLGKVNDAILRDELSAAKALIYPQEEDFGLVPLEALACGTPVIAYDRGGVKETLVQGKTGIFFEHQSSEDLAAAIAQFENTSFLNEDLFARAEEFSKTRFVNELTGFIKSLNLQ